jgi:fibronectin-binding autotransporter adhesin
MATDTWTGVYGGNWSDPTGWSGGAVPAAGDTVQLSEALNGPYTVHLDANEGPYAALTVSAANATLALYDGGLTLSVTGATTLSAGDIAIAGDATLDTGTFAESGGFLGMSNGTLDVSGQATLSGGGFGVYGGAFEAGSLAFAGGSFGISGGNVTVTNQVSETAGTAGFYGGTFDAGSIAVSGGSLGMSGGTIEASGALTLSGSGSIGLYNTAATLEAGSLSQTGGSLGMSGGTLAVTGQASFTGGTDVFYGGSTVDAGSLQIGSSGAAHTLTINGAVFAVSGTASIAAGSTLSMYGGSFSTQGGLTDSGMISGAGTIGGPLGGTGTVYAEQGTLDLTGTVASGLTFKIASYGVLKIDGTATIAPVLNMVDVHQVLEVGPSGNLTITAEQGSTAGTFKLDGGTLTDAQGFSTGNLTTITGFGTINGTEYGLGYERGATIEAVGGTLTLNGDVYSGVTLEAAAGATFSLLGAAQLNASEPGVYGTYPVHFDFLSSASGTFELGTATARQSFETNGTIVNMNVSTNGAATDVLDLADVASSSITSAMVANGNTIELFNGSTMIDHFSLASSVGTAAVHWVSDGHTGSNIFLSTT